VFKGSLVLDGRERVKGDIPLHVKLAEDKDDFERLSAESRRQSQAERETIFWVVQVDEKIDREVTEVFRSKEMITKKERGAQTAAETRLLYRKKVGVVIPIVPRSAACWNRRF
jgi:hypothetical protein